MRDPSTPNVGILLGTGFGLFTLVLACGLVTMQTTFITLLILSVVALAVVEYRAMLPLLLAVFFSAGADVPFQESAYAARWVMLAIAAVLGLAAWSRSPYKLDFGVIHLLSLFTIVAALFSAIGAVNRQVALLKCISLFLLFLYLSTGARVPLQGREILTVRRLVLVFQIGVMVCGVLYMLDLPYWYNPNSLGALMGIFAWPVLLWGYLIATTGPERRRALFFLCVCGVLLILSRARAGMLAASIPSIVLLCSLRRIRIAAFACLGLGIFFLSFFLIAPENFHDYTEAVIYKPTETNHELSVLGSRRDPWQATIKTINEHPWFGTGLGTPDKVVEGIFTTGSYRETGNSYLTVLQGLGLLGVCPFILLVILLVHRIFRMCLWMRRTGNPAHCAIPLVGVMLAGLIHAGFEDWLLSVGSYLCLIFWVITFWALDLSDCLSQNAVVEPVPVQPNYHAVSAVAGT